MDYVRLAAMMKTTPENARRCWEIWILSKAFCHATDERSAEENQFAQYAIESGLPDDASRNYIRACREYETVLARNRV